jgi:SAM-dependent methyltransferase
MVPTTEDALARHWRTLYEARTAQAARQRQQREGDFWGGRADIFARRIDTPDDTLGIILEKVQPGDTVLDVGGGAGRYAIPLAAHAKDVVVVEPSAGMGAALLQEAEKRHVANVRWIESDWLAASAPKADVVLCAHVLYFTPDAVAFVRRLNEYTLRECMILIRVDQAGAGLAPLYERIRGEPQAPEPSFIDLYNLLYQMDIVADVRVVEGRNSQGSFESLEAAETNAFNNLSPANDEQRALIRDYPAENLIKGKDGQYVFKNANRRVAIVSWRREDQAGRLPS